MKKKSTLGKNGLGLLILFCVIGISIAAASYVIQGLVTNVGLESLKQQVQYVMEVLFAAEVVIFLCYLLYMLRKVDKEKAIGENELNIANSKLEVQQILFDAHKNPECIESALRSTAQTFQAESAFLLVLDDWKIQEIYAWPIRNNRRIDILMDRDIRIAFPKTSESILQKESMTYYKEKNKTVFSMEEQELLEQLDIQNLMAAPVLNPMKQVKAVLGTFNTGGEWADTRFLESVARDFMMALNNVESFRMIRKMGTEDALTGLKNRNCYQQFLSQCSSMAIKSLGCIYIDANGLHELNNHLGHAAGDKMLISIGNTLRTIFGPDHVYRIGGDEFVVIAIDCLLKEVSDCVNTLKKNMEVQGYQISVGYSWKEDSWNLEKMIAEAEAEMYQEKHQYYTQKGDVKKSRELNHKLEQILQEKQDADTFLSIISPYFMGVYVVDLDTDDTRIIYQPSYFTVMLQQTEYKFMKALKKYVNIFVNEKERKAFLEFLNYDRIKEDLNKGKTLEYHYSRMDGSQLFLRICQSADYSDGKKEAFWIFEKYNGLNETTPLS
ncbi:MAG: GGDEF domain-containing protein [Lachnospiraceae bacterium]|nr:GGDEF domain-containing protein [Lachnospiraceae bacterium]MDD3617390.1 GGDEF domain-containing protein [Lachnospiraceae bacterium]